MNYLLWSGWIVKWKQAFRRWSAVITQSVHKLESPRPELSPQRVSSATSDQNKGSITVFFRKSESNDQGNPHNPHALHVFCWDSQVTAYQFHEGSEKVWGTSLSCKTVLISLVLNAQWSAVRFKIENYFQIEDTYLIMLCLTKEPRSLFWWWKLSGYKGDCRQLPPINRLSSLCGLGYL